MKALVLAAGKGKRLGNLTKTIPKPMVPVAGKPILERIIEGLKQVGFDYFVFVTGYKKEQVERFLERQFNSVKEYTVVHQAIQDGTGSAVALCADMLQNEPFFMTYGDILVDSAFYSIMMNRFNGDPLMNYMAVNVMDDPSAGCAVYVDGPRVIQLVEKPPPGTSRTPYNNAGLYVLQPEIFEALEDTPYSVRGERELTDALAVIAENGTMKHVEIEGFWSDVGTIESLNTSVQYFSKIDKTKL